MTEPPALDQAGRSAIVRDGLAVGLATGAYGISFGAVSVTAGLSVLQTCALSLLVFTGASQFALVGVLALAMDGILSLVQRIAVSPGLTGKFRNTGDNRPVVTTTARGDAAEPASPTDRADDQREALV